MDVSVIIVNYNVCEFLEQALRSVFRASDGLKIEVFVVDNNSIDESVDMVRERFPDVTLIANEHNVGFSKANNQAIQQARGRYLFILNPDTIVREDTLRAFVELMDESPDIGAAGCKILNPDGTFAPESRRSFPTPAVAFYRMTGLSKLFPRSIRFGRYNLSYLSPDEATEVDALSGSCMVVRREAIRDAGMFDEDFFMYGEDLDWCYRIQQAGWKVFYTPSTQIIHYKGESTKKGELRYVLLFYGAMLRFAQKHFRRKHSFLFRAMLRAGIIARGSAQAVWNGVRRIALPLTETALIFLAVSLSGIARFWAAGLPFPALYIALIAPLYTCFAIAGISLFRGYTRRGASRILPVIAGNGVALTGLAALSFFIKAIAFSRLAVAAGFLLATAVLSINRIRRGRRARSTPLFRRAVFVGDAPEAARFNEVVSLMPEPPFEITGYIAREACPPTTNSTLPCLGALRHLRDLVRLRQIDDVVFSSTSLSNRLIFDLIQELKDLPVDFKMLNEHHEHLIGQAHIDALSTPALIDAETAVGAPRSTLARRTFELPLVILGIFLYPLLLIVTLLPGATPGVDALLEKIRQFPAVLSGRKALIGYEPEEHPLISSSWNLKPGVFTITASMPPDTRHPRRISRAYWMYACNHSIALDVDIMLHSLNPGRHE